MYRKILTLAAGAAALTVASLFAGRRAVVVRRAENLPPEFWPKLASALKGGWLTPDALVIIEERTDQQDILPDGFHIIEERAYGLTKLVFAGLDRPTGTTEGPN